MVPTHGIPNKSYMLFAYELEKSVWFKPWKMAFTWFPSPAKVGGVMPPIDDAILALFDCSTGRAIVQRASLVTDPFAIKVVTWDLVSFFLFCQ